MSLADGISFTAASAGTGTFGFGSARASFMTLAQGVSAGEILDGQIVSYLAQDSLSSPTQREWGRGTFSAAGSGSIARTTVLGTVNNGVSGSGSALNFTVAPIVSLTALAEDFRKLLTANINFYVSVTGSDSHDGLSVGTAFATVQHAMNVIAAELDGGGFWGAIINIGAGSFAGVTMLPCTGLTFVQIYGAGSSSTTMTHDSTVGLPFGIGGCIDVLNEVDAAVAFNGLTLSESLGDTDIVAVYAPGQYVYVGDFINNTATDIVTKFTVVGGASFGVYTLSTIVFPTGTVQCNGAGQTCTNVFRLWSGARAIILGATFSFTGTPTYTQGFVFANAGSGFDASQKTVTFSGSFTGAQFDLTEDSFVQTNGVAIPGSAIGTGDNTCSFDGSYFSQNIGHLPTTADLPFTNQYALFNYTPTDTRQFVFNDNGTILPIGRIMLSQDTTFYVSTTGSDSNSGTLASPWATIQHAVNWVASNVDAAGFAVIIQIEDGTYPGASILQLPPNYAAYVVKGNSADATKVIVTNDVGSPGNACFEVNLGTPGAVTFRFLTFKITVGGANGPIEVDSPQTSIIFLSTDIVFDCTAAAAWSCISLYQNLCVIQGFTVNFTFKGNFTQYFDLQFQDACAFDFDNSVTFTHVGVPTISNGAIVAANGSSVTCRLTSVTGTFTGPDWAISNDCMFSTNVSTFGGSAAGTITSGFSNEVGYAKALQKSGLPAAADLVAGTWAVFKDTTGGSVRIAYNDGGTIKSVALT